MINFLLRSYKYNGNIDGIDIDGNDSVNENENHNDNDNHNHNDKNKSNNTILDQILSNDSNTTICIRTMISLIILCGKQEAVQS